MSALVRPVTHYSVQVEAKVRAKVRGHLSFTDAEVREWADIQGEDPVDPELINEYACEQIGEEGELDVLDVDYWEDTDVTILGARKAMNAPAAFVALPGMEGAL